MTESPAKTAELRIPVRNEKKIFLALPWCGLPSIYSSACSWKYSVMRCYYKLFSEHLDWGYFDHPPMIALMIRVSSFFFSGNLGVRFMTLILQLFTLLLIWMTLDHKRIRQPKGLYIFYRCRFHLHVYRIWGNFSTRRSPAFFHCPVFVQLQEIYQLTKVVFYIASCFCNGRSAIQQIPGCTCHRICSYVQPQPAQAFSVSGSQEFLL